MIKYLVAYVILGLAAYGVYAIGMGIVRFGKRDYDLEKYSDVCHEVIEIYDDTFIDNVANIDPDWLYYTVLALAWPITLLSTEIEILRRADRIYEERLKEEEP